MQENQCGVMKVIGINFKKISSGDAGLSAIVGTSNVRTHVTD